MWDDLEGMEPHERPGYAEAMCERADLDRKRAREDSVGKEPADDIQPCQRPLLPGVALLPLRDAREHDALTPVFAETDAWVDSWKRVAAEFARNHEAAVAMEREFAEGEAA